MVPRAKVIKTIDVPSKVDFADLADLENGRLVSEQEALGIENALAGHPPGRYSKKELGTKYGIIKEEDGSLYAVYKGERHEKELGAGAFGKVKLVQNIKTGEWKVLKVQKTITEGLAKLAEKEHETLTTLGMSHGNIIIREKEEKDENKPLSFKKDRKTNFTMDYGKGSELYKYLVVQQSLTALRTVDIALQALQGIEAMNQKGYLHRDIKLENMLYDAATNKVTVIDFGLTAKMDNTGKLMDKRQGTPAYMAPEIREGDEVPYTIAVDVYALGTMLKELCGFIAIEVEDTKIRVQSPLYADPELEKLLNSMTDEDPKQRPPLSKAIAFFQAWRQELLPITQKTIGIVQIADYPTALHAEGLIAALKSVDEVILVDSAENGDAVYYTETRRALENQGIVVKSEVLISDNPAELVKKAYELFEVEEKKSEVTISRFCSFRPMGSVGDKASLPDVQTIEVGDPNKDYRKEIQEKIHRVTDAQVQKIKEMLQSDLDRLEKKYQGRGGQGVRARIEILSEALQKIDQLYKNRELTYPKLSQELNTIEKRLIKTKLLSVLTFGLFKTGSARMVKQLEKNITNEPKRAPKLG